MAARFDPAFEQNVFINCPFDAAYAPMFEAIVFAVKDAGFEPRSALERLDSSQMRLDQDDLTFADLSGAIAAWILEHS